MQNIILDGQRQTVEMRLHEKYWKVSNADNPSNFDINGEYTGMDRMKVILMVEMCHKVA